jgi:hypothetical protein
LVGSGLIKILLIPGLSMSHTAWKKSSTMTAASKSESAVCLDLIHMLLEARAAAAATTIVLGVALVVAAV